MSFQISDYRNINLKSLGTYLANTSGPSSIQQQIPILQPTLPSLAKANSYFIIGRHAGRKSDSIFASTLASNKTSILSGITTDNEWVSFSNNPNYPLIDSTFGVYSTGPTGGVGVSLLQGVQTSGPTGYQIFGSGGINGTGDERPLSNGGVNSYITYLNIIKKYLPTSYNILSCNATKRTAQTASIFYKVIAPDSTFRMTDYYRPSYSTGQISTTNFILAGDPIYAGTGLKITPSAPVPVPGVSVTSNAVISGLSTELINRFQSQIYTNGHLVQLYPSKPMHSEVFSIVSRWFNYTSSTFSLEYNMINMIDWIIQQYIDGGPWVTNIPNTPNYLDYSEYVILQNFLFSNLYSSGTSVFNSAIVSNLKSNYDSWKTGSGNQIYIGHDTTVQAFLSSLNLASNSSVNHCSYIPGVFIVFVKSVSGNVTGYVISPLSSGSSFDISALSTKEGNSFL